MNKLFIFASLCLGLSTQAFADEMSMQMPEADSTLAADMNSTNTSKMPSMDLDLVEEPNWAFTIGQARFENGTGYNTGSGIAIGVDRRFTDMFGMGIGITDFKAQSHSSYTGEMHGRITPIRYEFANVSLTGAINLGLMAAEDTNDGAQIQPFYGATLGAAFNKQVGFQFDAKSVNNLPAISSLALVGYY